MDPPMSPQEDDARRSRTGPVALSLLPAVLLGVALTILLVRSPELRSEFSLAWSLLIQGEPEALQAWLLDFGVWAPVVSGLLQIVTSVFPPGPSFLLGIVNAMVFGPVLGGLLTFGTALVAAAVCFGIARLIGRPGVERLVSEEKLRRMDDFMARRGMLAIFLGRIIPFINPDLVSYAAGVTGIRWLPFLVAMAAGSFPSTVFYSIIGAAAVETTGWIVGLVVASTLVPLVLLWIYRRRARGK
jgi:uncharacterized membrane protein YdjX (TVP38/TMEM64 family)